MNKINVAVLMGGKSSEREVSLNSGKEVLKHLDKNKYNVSQYDPLTDLEKLIKDHKKIDLAFLALHGPWGEDGTIQGFLELIGLPYTGSGVLASAIAMDKVMSKQIYRNANVPVADDFIIYKHNYQKSILEEALKHLGDSLVIKPIHQGSSLGLNIAHNKKDIETSIAKAFELDTTVLLEKYIKGRELTTAVIGHKELIALPSIEIIPNKEYTFFDYTAKYKTGASQEICPAEISTSLADKLSHLAIKAHQILLCRHLSRTDFIYGDDEKLYVLETNTLPGMTANSLLPKAAVAYGLNFSQLLDKLINFALEK